MLPSQQVVTQPAFERVKRTLPKTMSTLVFIGRAASQTQRVFANVTRALLTLIAIGLLSGCSIVEFAYNRADWFAMNYADDLVGLDESQKASLEAALKSRLETHRREELPDYITYTQDAQTLLSDGVDQQEVTRLIEDLRALYDKAAIRTASTIAPTIASLTAEQSRELATSFAEKNEEFEDEYLAPDLEERAQDRLQRIRKRMEHWTGSLDSNQVTLLDQQLAQIDDVTHLWFSYRQKQQALLIDAIAQGSEAVAIERLLVNWWVTPGGRG